MPYMKKVSEELKGSWGGAILSISKGIGLYHIIANLIDELSSEDFSLYFLINFSEHEIDFI